MCTAVLSIEPGLPVLLAGVRDEFTGRAWQPPQRHWQRHPDLVGGRDMVAGGTWLAVSPAHRRASCVLNGRGQMAPAESRRSRGILPLLAVAGEPVDEPAVADLDPFHLLTVLPGRVIMHSWDGLSLTERELSPGLHFVVNSGLASELMPDRAGDDGGGRVITSQPPNGREHELARVAHFAGKFASAARPDPRPDLAVGDAWGSWLPLVNGDGLDSEDLRALVVRREFPDGRVWGTTSISLIALSPDYLRYDFTAAPADPAAWYQVL